VVSVPTAHIAKFGEDTKHRDIKNKKPPTKSEAFKYVLQKLPLCSAAKASAARGRGLGA